MSSTLCFRQTPESEEGVGRCKYPLKRIFAKKYYDHDGSLGGDIITLTYIDLPWLQGVQSVYNGDDKEVLDEIIKLIEQAQTVDMWFEV